MIGVGLGGVGWNAVGRAGDSWALGTSNFDPGFSHRQQVGDELGDGVFRRKELHLDQILAEGIVKSFEVTGDLASVVEIERRLEMANDEDGVVDALGAPADVVLVNGDGRLAQVFDDLLIEADH